MSGAPVASLRVEILTAFPGFFSGPLGESLLGRGISRGLIDVRVIDLREHGLGPHRQLDDYAYGGGAGMVMRPEPLFAAVEALGEGRRRMIVLSPAGRLLDQALVRELAREPALALICGRYEGVDQRVIDGLGAEEISVGDYVLAGGETAALVILDAVARLVPGVVGNETSLAQESFEDGLLEHPHYTRPREVRGLAVPEVLLSGDHVRIDRWRREAAREKTRRNRPDLVQDPREGDSQARGEGKEGGAPVL